MPIKHKLVIIVAVDAMAVMVVCTRVIVAVAAVADCSLTTSVRTTAAEHLHQFAVK